MAKAKKVKIKSNRGAAKRFRKTKGGYKCRSANTRHGMTNKPAKRKLQARKGMIVRKCENDRIDQMLPCG